jgi:uncharacterized membrane protein YdbT with pleckstrin-like domain
MSYVDKNLIPGETVVYRGHLSRLPYWWLVLPVAGAIAAAVYNQLVPAAIVVGVGVVMWAWITMRLRSTEFAVTSRRVVIKVGALQRKTVEMMLGQIEGVTVDQGITGRIFNFGSITVIGSGGTRESFEHMVAPLEFRRQVQAQLARQDDERLEAARSGGGAPG